MGSLIVTKSFRDSKFASYNDKMFEPFSSRATIFIATSPTMELISNRKKYSLRQGGGGGRRNESPIVGLVTKKERSVPSSEATADL